MGVYLDTLLKKIVFFDIGCVCFFVCGFWYISICCQ